MAFCAASLLKAPSALEQLLEEINFQRTKEMRQLLKDDSGFVVLQGTTYWTDLFVRHFLFQDEQAIDCDDLLFFVRKKHVKGSSRYLPKYETSVDVFRKDSKKLPIGDPDIDWEETVYLNLIIHQFDYTLTLAICTRTSPKELQVLKRHSQKVYASPSRRKMDTKGEGEEMTYPHICFMVDNFDEVFCDILVRDGEMVCVELVASDRRGAVQGVIFLGSIRYDALNKVYDARQSSLSTKVAQRMTFGLFASACTQRCEFVRMKGPQGKGHAEMAVTRPRGSGVETPTSEPGYCATDMWDSDWDEDPDDFYVYRHQRRLSDPSSNLNNFSRSGWKTRNYESAGSKSRSENEGLDSLANTVSEIEAGDLRDEQASSTRPASPPRCCCAASSSSPSCDMSEVYRRDADQANETPACLNTVTPNKEKPSGPAPAPPPLKAKTKPNKPAPTTPNKPKEPKPKATKPNLKETKKETTKSRPPWNRPEKTTTKPQAKVHSEKKATIVNIVPKKNAKANVASKKTTVAQSAKKAAKPKSNKEEYELADDAASFCVASEVDNKNKIEVADEKVEDDKKIGRISDLDPNTTITVNGKEELPCTNEIKNYQLQGNRYIIQECEEVQRVIATETYTQVPETAKTIIEINKNVNVKSNIEITKTEDDCNGNEGDDEQGVLGPLGFSGRGRGGGHARWGLGLRGRSNGGASQATKTPGQQQGGAQPPKRTTPDGTDIYYWCDLPKKNTNELDDGAYNPLWAMRGFTQTFHFWKENKRQQSTPLNAFLTYVTLPWWSIAKDILDHREGPILTF